MAGDSDSPSDPARSVEDRLAAIEAMVRTGVICAAEIRAKRLVICDDSGRARIVTELRRGTTEVRIAVDADDDRRPMMVLFAGDTPHFGPAVGVHLVVDDDDMAAFDTGVGPDGERRTDLSGVGLSVTDQRPTD